MRGARGCQWSRLSGEEKKIKMKNIIQAAAAESWKEELMMKPEVTTRWIDEGIVQREPALALSHCGHDREEREEREEEKKRKRR